MSHVDPSELEPELEALLKRWVPDIDKHWGRASDQEIAAIEDLAGGALPRCYRWMLLRLGNGWNEIGCGSLDFSARTIIDGHTNGIFDSHEGMLCIAADSAEDQPQPRYYDLAHPAKDDAPVFMAGPEELDFDPEFESLRELIASAVFDNHRLGPMPVQCEGILTAPDGSNALQAFAPRVESLGFTSPVPCGPLCLLYDDGDVAFSSYRSPVYPMPTLLPFDLGGPSEAAIRKFLGLVTTATELQVTSLNWSPPR